MLSLLGVLTVNDHAPAAVGVTDTTRVVVLLATTGLLGCVVIDTVQFTTLAKVVAAVMVNDDVPLLVSI